MRRIAGALLSFLLLLTSVSPALAHEASGMPPGPPPAIPAVQGHKVSLGRATMGSPTIIYNQNIPGTIFINEGETVTFVNESGPPHTVTFVGDRDPRTLTEPELMAPTRPSGTTYDGGFFSSGILHLGQSFRVSFSKAGVYPYFCALHPEMTGTVVVLPKGVPAPSLEQQNAAAEQYFKAQSMVAAALHQSAELEAPARKLNADGTMTWTVNMGASANSVETMAFYPSYLRIREGDTVLFHMPAHSAELHSASVNRPVNMYVVGDGPMGMNPAFLKPAGSGTVDGTGAFVGTGLVFPGAPDAKLTFTKAGTYHIHCDLHDFMGMVMTIHVAPRNAVDVFVNGKRVEAGAVLKSGLVFAQVRALTEALGGSISYDAATDTALATVGTANVTAAGSSKARLNGHDLDQGLEVKSFKQENRIYVPAASFATILGGSATWDAQAGILWLEIPTEAPQAGHNH